MATLTPEKKALMFKQLATKSSFETGIEFGLDKYYKNAATVGAVVIRIYNEVKNNPEKFLISNDTVDLVTAAVKSRNALIQKGESRTTLREKMDEAKSRTFEELALDNRAKAAQLLSLRLDDGLSSRKKREKISLGEAAKVYGITFDKGQLLEGKATDHVALMGKVEGDINPEQAMKLIQQMKDYNTALQENK